MIKGKRVKLFTSCIENQYRIGADNDLWVLALAHSYIFKQSHISVKSCHVSIECMMWSSWMILPQYLFCI